MSELELVAGKQVERADFALADNCSDGLAQTCRGFVRISRHDRAGLAAHRGLRRYYPGAGGHLSGQGQAGVPGLGSPARPAARGQPLNVANGASNNHDNLL